MSVAVGRALFDFDTNSDCCGAIMPINRMVDVSVEYSRFLNVK